MGVAVQEKSFRFVRKVGGISEYTLKKNGLQILHKRESAAPVVAVCVTFHVGSRNEAKGHTGSTHILEHLLFKDSKNFNRANGNAITDYLEWFGAYLNATTWLDRTNYFELLPREHFEKALALEADRMRDSLFSDADLQSEMPVVRNEYERTRNNPFELLDEEVMAKAFIKHPYHIPTIGTKEDIEGSDEKKLREFYDTFYWPNNATLSVFGDVAWKEVAAAVVKYFGAIPRAPRAIPRMSVVEPVQKETQNITLTKPLGISIAMVGYKIPSATHRDYPALLMLGTILGGGFSSRLQKALVDRGLAAEISVSVPALHDPGLMVITAHIAEGATPKKVLETLEREIQAFKKEGPTKEELARAKQRLVSQFAFERDGVFSEIRAVSESIAAGDWALGFKLESAITKMTLAPLKSVAKKYLNSSQKTVGTLTP